MTIDEVGGSMDFNLYSVLKGWLYQLHQISVKIIEREGESKLKVTLKSSARLYDVVGRPDGVQPYNVDSVYDHLFEKSRRMRENKMPFEITSKERSELEEEIALFLFRALAFYRLHEFFFCEKDLLFAVNALEFIIKNNKDHIIKDHYGKYLDVIILLYQKNLSLLFQKNNDAEGASFALKLAQKTLQQIQSKSSTYQFYFSEKDLKALNQFVFEQVPLITSQKEDVYLQLAQVQMGK